MTITAEQSAAALHGALAKFTERHYRPEAHAIDYSAATVSREFGEVRRALDALAIIDPGDLPTMANRMAFWVNLYNAVALEGVAEQPGVASVRDIDEFFTLPRRVVGGNEFSLDDIEHGILRANGRKYLGVSRWFRANDPRLRWSMPGMEPRIHFVLYTASVASPPLGTFDSAGPEEALDRATARVLDRDTWLDDDGRTLYLPRTFYWYEGDFDTRRDILQLLRDHLPNDRRRHAINRLGNRVRLAHTEYNWMINDHYTLAL